MTGDLILLDTNVLLLLDNIDSNEDINKEILRKYLSTKEVCVSTVTIFEILNNKSYRDEFSNIIHNLETICLAVSFIGDLDIGEYCSFDLLSFIEDKSVESQTLVYKSLGRYIIDSFASFYACLYSAVLSMLIMIFLNFDNQNVDKEYSSDIFGKFMQENYNDLAKIIYILLNRSFNKLLEADNFNEKNRNIIFSNLYFQLSCAYSQPYNAALISLDKNDFSFSRLANECKKANVSIKNIKIDFDYKNQVPFSYMSLYHSFIRENPEKKQIVEDYLRKIVNCFCNEEDMRNKYMNELFRKSLLKLTFENTNLSSNDYLDALIVSCSFDQNQLNKKINKFMSFDKKFVRSLNNFSTLFKENIVINEKPCCGQHYIK